MLRDHHQTEADRTEGTSSADPGVPVETSIALSNFNRRRVRRRPPLSVNTRTKSDFGAVHRSFKIGTILEGKQQASDDSSATKDVANSAADCGHSLIQEKQEGCASRRSSDKAENSREMPSFPHDTPSAQLNALSEGSTAKSSSDTRPSLSWMRTLSGGILFDRSSSGRDASSSHQDPSPSHRSTPPGIKPLRPPTLPRLNNLNTSDEHQVRVETPFSRPNQTKPEQEDIDTREHVSFKPLIDPRELFPSYVKLVRRIGKSRTERNAKPLFSTKSRAVPRFHRSGWRRDNIPSALHRVSSLLSDIRSMRSREKLRFEQSPDSMSAVLGARAVFSTSVEEQPLPVERVRSMEFGAGSESESSSLIRLRIGTQPPNTPSEQATYRAKRSPDAESEEFLKIDISIRGGTSYLPSEARRVHTPPLPKERPNRRRRGFFFDYNAFQDCPEHRHDRYTTAVWVHRDTGQARAEHKSKTSQGLFADCRSVQESRSTRSGVSPTVDWYGLQLAELDLMGNDNSLLPLQAQSRSSTFIFEELKWQEEEKMDYNIPEHLPSSPLCPRHPRYWRIVKGRGSQYRGCWMHGIGLWEADLIPGTTTSARKTTLTPEEV